MKYSDGQLVMLGDIVSIGMHDGPHQAKVILLGDTGEYSELDEETVRWAIDSGHVDDSRIMAVWTAKNPLEHNDPMYAPVGDTISTDLCCVALVRRGSEPDAGVNAASPRGSA
jgi:hypothetical protein